MNDQDVLTPAPENEDETQAGAFEQLVMKTKPQTCGLPGSMPSSTGSRRRRLALARVVAVRSENALGSVESRAGHCRSDP